MRKLTRYLAFVLSAALALSLIAFAQQRGGGAAPPAGGAGGGGAAGGRGAAGGGRGGGGGNAQQAAPIDLTGYWVSVLSEDWEFRMVTPRKSVYDTLNLN